MIDQYSPKQLGSSVGKPIKSFHLSLKQQGEGNILNPVPRCPFLPPENRLLWQSAGASPLSAEKTSVWMWKSLTKFILLLLEFFLLWHHMGTVLLAPLTVFCWRQKSLAAHGTIFNVLLNKLGGPGIYSLIKNIWQSNMNNKTGWELYYRHRWTVWFRNIWIWRRFWNSQDYKTHFSFHSWKPVMFFRGLF